MKYKDNEERLRELKSFKLIIHNCTVINMIKVFKDRVIEHRNQPLVIEYDKINLNFYSYWFNAFEISDNCPLQQQSHSCLIIICIQFDGKSYTKMAEKAANTLLYYLYNVNKLLRTKMLFTYCLICFKNFMYLSISFVVVNQSKQEFDENKLSQKLEKILGTILDDIKIEEDKIPTSLKNMEFQQQENFRDLMRVKHAIHKFLDSKNRNIFLFVLK
jgi:hypothetical protein